MAVKVQFEIGHTSKLRSKKTPHPQAFTHDWEIYVQGVNKADISAFVEKVVFLLHESFPKPKRSFKEPPYAIQESGYAGFILPVEIHFRSRDEPRRIVYQYDLVLQSTGPPQHHVEVKTHIFEAPSEEFRVKLMRGGGVPVFGTNIGTSSLSRTLSPSGGVAEVGSNNEMGLVKAKGGPTTVLVSTDLSAGKKHKSRNDDPGKSNAFSALFGPPITKSSAAGNSQAMVPISKHSPEAKSLSTGVGSKGSSHDGKEKTSKEREKSSGGDKTRDKDKKDRHGRDKDRKSSKSGEGGGKHEHKDKEKSKKDKTRDKDREREQSSGSTPSSGFLSTAASIGGATGALVKHTASPKPGKPVEMTAPSPKKAVNDSVAVVPTSRSKERDEHKSGKSESKDKERSSSKKSKKEKKDKDKEREKQRDEHKDKRLPKEERAGQSDSPAAGIAESTQKQSVASVTGKATPTSVGSNSSSSMASGGVKQREDSTGSKHPEKTTDSKADKGTSNGSAAEAKKSHKHKKKDKNKEKDKERIDRDKDKEKDRDKDKPKEREKDKQQASNSDKPSAADPSPKTDGASPAAEAATTDKLASNASSSSGKKEKHKKSKEKSSNKDEKRQRETASEKQPEGKHPGKPQGHPGQGKTPSNLDLSDVDSAQSAPDLAATSALAAAAAATLQHSDSSNSSFPDLPARSSINSQQKPTKGSSGSGKEAKQVANKEHKTKSKPVDKITDKSERADRTPDNKLDKFEKSEKEEKKRNRRSSQNSNSGSAGGFIEPPVKSSKKEQMKVSREKSKSPSLRPPRDTNSSGSGTPNTVASFLPPPQSSPSNNHTGAGTNAASLNNNTTNNNSGHSPAEITAPGHLQLPTEYLSELQELHHKIMTLQDNEELQHVVEMIAATGCYEITHKTFDFDLCKLDRGTVQRLQEFLATSVS
ncbi:hypothetical protein KR009_009201 [Drosophila setifemur]|nr:hypothetical protein KR009_009201 [Drosophila setifemur]